MCSVYKYGALFQLANGIQRQQSWCCERSVTIVHQYRIPVLICVCKHAVDQSTNSINTYCYYMSCFSNNHEHMCKHFVETINVFSVVSVENVLCRFCIYFRSIFRITYSKPTKTICADRSNIYQDCEINYNTTSKYITNMIWYIYLIYISDMKLFLKCLQKNSMKRFIHMLYKYLCNMFFWSLSSNIQALQ